MRKMPHKFTGGGRDAVCGAHVGLLGAHSHTKVRSRHTWWVSLNVCRGWICDGPLTDGEARIRTFIWWRDLAVSGTDGLECGTSISRRLFTEIANAMR